MNTKENSVGEMLREAADRLFQAHCDTATRRAADQGRWPTALWAAVEEAGLPRALVPEEAGGFGVPVADALSLLKVAGAHAVPLPLAETMLASWLLAGAGLNIPDGPLGAAPVRDGESLTLTSTEGDWRIAGTLTRIPWARDVDHLVVMADARILLAGRDSGGSNREKTWRENPGTPFISTVSPLRLPERQ